MKTLYAKDSNGNVLDWTINVINHRTHCDIKISYGRLTGEKVIRYERDIRGKNIGKSNETTPLEQAESRLQSRVNDKKKRGYIELEPENERHVQNLLSDIAKEEYLQEILPKDRRDSEGFIKPMKAAQYFKSKKNWVAPDGTVWKDRKYFYLQNPHAPKEKGAIAINFPCIIQPKINGVRGFIFVEDGEVRVKSKEGLTYTALSHITDYFNMNIDLLEHEGESLVLDGEFYIQGESLQDIQSCVKAYNMNTPRVKFILFDLAIEGYTNVERIKIINTTIKNNLSLDAPVEVIKSFLVKNDITVQDLTNKFISEGYEGSILRTREAEYQFGSRKNNMVKLKRLISHDFIITDIIPQPKNKELGMFVCKYKEKSFNINPTNTEADKALFLLNKGSYIGKKVQCDFYEWTNDDKPYHIVNTVIRDYE